VTPKVGTITSFVRPRDLEPISQDLTQILATLMGMNATLEEILHLLEGEDDGEEEASES
jgi:hypothetical protein